MLLLLFLLAEVGEMLLLLFLLGEVGEEVGHEKS